MPGADLAGVLALVVLRHRADLFGLQPVSSSQWIDVERSFWIVRD
jgi:hypothetical protein